VVAEEEEELPRDLEERKDLAKVAEGVKYPLPHLFCIVSIYNKNGGHDEQTYGHRHRNERRKKKP
jgi:hypothetical protein